MPYFFLFQLGQDFFNEVMKTKLLIVQTLILKFSLLIKVSQSQKQILKFSSEPKTKRKYFCISALASKIDQIQK